MMRKILTVYLVFVSGICSAQVVISAGATLSAANNPDIVIVTASNITNNSAFDFSSTQLHLSLTGSNQNLIGNLSPLRMRIDGGGVKTINGNLTVTSELSLLNGFLKPTGTGKILFTGAEESLSDAGEASFVDGAFFINGTGFRSFPIGVQGLGYVPASIENASGQEIGIHVVNSNAGLSPAASEVEIAAIDNSHYWEVTTDNPGSFSSSINLSLNGITDFGEDFSPVVIEADAVGGEAYNLGSLSASETSISSLNPFTRKILAIGASTEVDIKIHDLISPFTPDNLNDGLYIENIAKFPTNTVILLDRWGVPVKEWSGFTNYNDPVNPNSDPFNFTTLTPGNYICVVEYESPTQGKRKKSQMVTVLKIK
jgi:hypothetical protein